MGVHYNSWFWTSSHPELGQNCSVSVPISGVTIIRTHNTQMPPCWGEWRSVCVCVWLSECCCGTRSTAVYGWPHWDLTTTHSYSHKQTHTHIHRHHIHTHAHTHTHTHTHTYTQRHTNTATLSVRQHWVHDNVVAFFFFTIVYHYADSPRSMMEAILEESKK